MKVAAIYGRLSNQDARLAYARAEADGFRPCLRNPAYFHEVEIPLERFAMAYVPRNRKDMEEAFNRAGVEVRIIGTSLPSNAQLAKIVFHESPETATQYHSDDPLIRDGAWFGQPAFIIGGGPSLKDFDFSRLEGRNVIAINRAVEFCDPDIVFSMDTRFIKWIKNGILGDAARAKWKDMRATLVFANTARNSTEFPHLPDRSVVLPVKAGGEFTTTLADGVGHGLNSGFGAVNLAICMGANPIFLLGFDMKGGEDGKQAWFHNGYPDQQSGDVYNRFANAFEKAVAGASGLPKIVNLCADSGLTCFERSEPEPWLDKTRKRPLFCSYATIDTPYVAELAELEETLAHFGLDKFLPILPNRGSWEKNCIQKMDVIAEAMRTHPDRPVVWVDADARIKQTPHLLLTMQHEVDFAVHYCHTRRQKNVLNSGTLYFAPTKQARKLMERWEIKNKENPDEWDQRNLQAATKFWRGNTYELPVEYCAIHNSIEEKCDRPIIEQFQASRRLKKAVSA